MRVASNSVQRGRLTHREYIEGVLAGDRVVLARAITLIESELPSDAELAAKLLDGILPHTGKAHRIGITGIPGAGKSTFIDAFGMHLIREYKQKIAVLSVDPSSPISGGSILGDKTRMERLSVENNAFIRPSPARGHFGGVARTTRETILLCEAAGFDNIVVETVGVGQSETAVRSMTDFFLLITIAGGGDELQVMKRGIIELVDAIAVNKADSDNECNAERARAEYSNALRLFRPNANGWSPRVVATSAVTARGIAEILKMIVEHRTLLESTGVLAAHRRAQSLEWMRDLIVSRLEDLFRTDAQVAKRLPELEDAVRDGTMTAFSAAHELLAVFTRSEADAIRRAD
ncbi:MAG: methylmalonyl Co-A mutase-associated GTPase MeaB [Acidobacteriaceae bacterium]|nr:methylmalonyl Co-A mutase-associated GTPase MeaB [Acidobacteriaceae bacterium]